MFLRGSLMRTTVYFHWI